MSGVEATVSDFMEATKRDSDWRLTRRSTELFTIDPSNAFVHKCVFNSAANLLKVSLGQGGGHPELS